MADQDDDQKKLAMAAPDAQPKAATPVATIAPPGAPLPATPPQMQPNASTPQLPGIAPPTALPAPAMPNPVAPPMGVQPQNRIPALPPPQIQSGGAKLWQAAGNIQNPVLRTLAKVGTGVARAGEIAGEALVPRVAELIPGSEINTRQQNAGNEQKFEKRQAEGVAQEEADTKSQQAETEQQRQQSEAGLQKAQAGALTGGQPVGEPLVINGKMYQPTYDKESKQATLQPMEGAPQSITPQGGPTGITKAGQIQKPEEMLVPPAQVTSFPKTLKDEYPGLKDTQISALAQELGPNPTQGDMTKVLNHADSLMNQTQNRDLQETNRKFQESIAQQNLDLRKDARELQDKQPVIGVDSNGRQVMVNSSEADKSGLTAQVKADANDVGMAISARKFIPLADKQGKTPQQMGILQLIDKLDKDGKLGPLASRWNDFMAGTWGAGDPDYEALRVKGGLAQTLLLKMHVGGRGGQNMLEHFKGLADAGKMDAATLKSGIQSELDYAKDAAMQPEGGGGNSETNSKGGPAVGTVRTINGQKAKWDGKGWLATK